MRLGGSLTLPTFAGFEFFHSFGGGRDRKDPPRRLTPSAPPERGLSWEPSMPAWPATQSMKISYSLSSSSSAGSSQYDNENGEDFHRKHWETVF